MNVVRTEAELQRLLAFLAKAPVDRVIPRAQTSQFPRGALVCTGDHLAECAFLLLSGSCEHRRHLAGGGTETIRTFRTAETFGGPRNELPRNGATEVVAAEDSVVLGIRLDDLAELAAEVNGHAVTLLPVTTDRPRTSFFFKPPKGRLVTLAFLSSLLPARFLGESVARRLRAETEESVVLVRLCARGEAADFMLDGNAGLPGELRMDESGVSLLNLGIPAEPPDAEDETWPEFQQALEASHSSARKLFSE